MLLAPETSARTGSIGFQRLSVPAEIRPVFVTAATAAFAGFAVMGLFTAVAPSFVSGVIGIGNHAVAGAVAGSIFVASAVAQLSARRIPPRARRRGRVRDPGGRRWLILAAALHFSSLSGLIVAAAWWPASGRASVSAAAWPPSSRHTPADRRAEVSSTYFVVAYVGHLAAGPR